MSYPWQGTGSGLLQLPIPPKADSFPLKCSLSQNHLDLLQTYEIPIRMERCKLLLLLMPGRLNQREKAKGMPQLWPGITAQSFFFWETIFYKRPLCSWAKSSINVYYMFTAQYQGSCWYCLPSKRQKRNSSRKGSAQPVKVHEIFFPGLSGSYQAEYRRVIWFKLLGRYLVRYRFAPIRKLSWCPWWTFLECLPCARHCIQLMNLPIRRMFLRNPCKQ